MRYHYTVYSGILFLTAIIAALIGYIAWKRRYSDSPAIGPFVFLMLAVSGYALVAGLEAAATPLPIKIMWSTFEYVGSGSVIALFLIFAFAYTHQRLPSRRAMLLVWLIPVFNVGLVASNHWHRLVWIDFLPGPPGSNQVIYEHGPGFYWVIVWVYIYALSSVWLFARAMWRPGMLYRRQSILILAGATIPLIGVTAYALGMTPPGLNITPMTFLPTGFIYLLNMVHTHLFDLVPVARDTLIEHMSDGVVVLDAQNRLVDINPAAQQFFGTTAGCIGQPAVTVLAAWSDILHLCQEQDEFSGEIVLESADTRYVELRITHLFNRHGRRNGLMLVIRDVTRRHQADLELQQANLRLRRQLYEIEILQTQLREQAIRDGLTGLFNRRYFEEAFVRELMRAIQEGYPVAVILLDIDHFKQINDTFGHQAGDQVLRYFAELLRSFSRTHDLACRYGGEEFVLALPGMIATQAYERAEQIRVAFTTSSVGSGDYEISTTVSGGVGVFPDHGNSLDSLMHTVDQALYVAKRDGRNRMRLACDQAVCEVQ